MKRIICVIGMVITLLCVPTETVIAAECVNQGDISYESNSTKDIWAEKIGYVYKTVNGKLYKRLYNYSRGEWIGDWILCN